MQGAYIRILGLKRVHLYKAGAVTTRCGVNLQTGFAKAKVVQKHQKLCQSCFKERKVRTRLRNLLTQLAAHPA